MNLTHEQICLQSNNSINIFSNPLKEGYEGLRRMKSLSFRHHLSLNSTSQRLNTTQLDKGQNQLVKSTEMEVKNLNVTVQEL